LHNKHSKLEPVFRFLAKIIIRLLYDVKYSGFDKIPKTGPVLLIANHVSYMDGPILQSCCKRPIRFIIDESIYSLPMINYFMRKNRAIPVVPSKESVQAMLDAISDGLENGDAICIFPEGQLTYTGNLGRFKPGIEWIIERDPVPIYPIAIKGLWNSMFSRKYLKSVFRWFPKGIRGRVTLLCGDVIHPGSATVNHMQRVVLGLKNSLDKS